MFLVVLGGPAHAERLFLGRVFVVGDQPWEIASADLDLDGHSDLVTVNNASFGPSVLFGRGDGSFEPEIRLSSTPALTAVALEDMDGDGVPDIVLGGLERIVLFRGHGDRTFDEGVTYYSWVNNWTFSAMAVADFNVDGSPDVVLGARPSISTHLGLGGGALGPPDVLPSGEAIHYVAPGDYDEDGCIDFAADDSNGGNFRLWSGDCEGAFEPGPPIASFGFDGESGDFNGDGHLDLATVLGDVYVNLGRGNGSFDPPVRYATGVSGARKMASVDLNGDGHTDFSVSSWRFETTIGVLLSNGDGTFQPAQHYASPIWAGAMARGDFDSDGSMDLALASLFGIAGPEPELKTTPPRLPSAFVGVLFGDGQGGLGNERVERMVIPETEDAIGADFDGDGIDDIALSLYSAVWVGLGDGDGKFSHVGNFNVGEDADSLAVAFLDAGSTPDLVTANLGSADVSILLGNGDGTFVTGPAIPIGTVPVAVAVANLLGGDAVDLATANRDADTVSVFSGNGDGTFAPVGVFPAGDEPVGLIATNLDDAGGLDLAIVNQGSMDISVLLGAGDGTFSAESRHPTGIDSPHEIVSADFNHDGSQDLAVAGSGDLTVLAVLYGDGQGGFASPAAIGVSVVVRELTVADIDGDGWEDLIAAHFEPLVTVLLGGAAGFAPRMEFVASSRGSVAVGEFNHDGLLDLAVSDWYSHRLAVLLNQLDVPIEFESSSSMTWRRLVGYDRFNTYRGALTDLSGAAPNWGACRNAFDPDLTDNTLVDDEVPAVGEGFFYLMARVRGGVESDLGTASNGQPRTPVVPCE